jgi:serine phosphatase RsbU (regulator of sigma subunit)
MISRNPVPRAGQTAAGGAPAAPRDPNSLFLAALPFAVVIAVAVIDVLAGPEVGFLPVLSLGPALAAISRRPLSTALIGMLALVLGALLAVYDNLEDSRRGAIALIAIAGVTAAGVVASAGRQRRERELANFKTIAEAAQQILLRPVPARIPPADIAVRYVSAAASARIGGDLYEVIAAGSGIRLIVGDVLGKGLPAARTAAVVLGAFREAAYDALGLAQIAARIEASLQHQEAQEEFVTAVLAQVDADGSRVEILSCGHPPPLLVRDGAVTLAEPPEADLPLGLAALRSANREVCVIPFKDGDRLLFYTDGISEARDKHGTFYPLERTGTLLGVQDLGTALDGLIEDVLAHVGHALLDDAALLLIGRGQPLSACRRALRPSRTPATADRGAPDTRPARQGAGMPGARPSGQRRSPWGAL